MQLQSYKSLKEGYTLIELLVGITIISIVFTIGFAGFREFSRRQALSGVTKSIKADLRLAQQLSLTGQKPNSDQGTCTQLNGYTFKIESITEYTISANCTNANRVVKTVDLDTNVSISPNLSSVQFKVLGQGTNLVTDYVISLSHSSGAAATITVGTGGEVN
jgi:prepilin-type N-terminal cleavage/methylation domain-containing protein